MKKRMVLALLLTAAMNISFGTAVRAEEPGDVEEVLVEEELVEEELVEEEPVEEELVEEELVEEEPAPEEIIEEEPASEEVEEIVAEHTHNYSEWFFDNYDTHSRYCDDCKEVEYQAHYFGEDMKDSSYYTCVCGYKDYARRDKVLAPVKEAAITDLECQSIDYGKYCGANVRQVREDARRRINNAESIEEIQSIFDEASGRMEEEVIFDARNYATNLWLAELDYDVYCEDLEYILEEGNTAIYQADKLKDIAAIEESVLNEIRAYVAEYPNVSPMIQYAAQIEGTYTDPDTGASIVIAVNADGEAVVTLIENGNETIIDTGDAFADEDVIIIQANTNTMYYIYLEDGSACAIHEQVGRHGRDFVKGGSEMDDNDPIPEPVILENPVCPQCGAKLALVSTNGSECTWICETEGCGLVTVRHHGEGEVCVCADTCAHEYGAEGDARFTCIKCGEHVNEAKKAEAERADAYAALMAEFDAFKMAQMEAAEALGAQDTAELVENTKSLIAAYVYNNDLSLEENEAAIVKLVEQLAADIDFYNSTKEPEIGEEIELKEGTYALFLDDEFVGIYTFTKFGKGWAIQDENGKYLGIVVENKEGYLTLTDVAFEWSYNGGAFRGSDKNGKQYCLASADSVRKPKVEASIHEIIED